MTKPTTRARLGLFFKVLAAIAVVFLVFDFLMVGIIASSRFVFGDDRVYLWLMSAVTGYGLWWIWRATGEEEP